MPSWIKEPARLERLIAGHAYSKRQVAQAIEVSIPTGPRDWGGIVRFANGIALFVTLEKGVERYAEKHRYNDRFDGDLLYWDSRASHDKNSRQVEALRGKDAQVVAFARVSERRDGRSEAFSFLGPLEFVDWWGVKPVHFTWRLRAFPEGLGGGGSALQALAQWKPSEIQSRGLSTSRSLRAIISDNGPSSLLSEGAKRSSDCESL